VELAAAQEHLLAVEAVLVDLGQVQAWLLFPALLTQLQ
jgi:hypothetical protein